MHLLQHSRRKESGYILVTDTVTGVVMEEHATAQCCHCGLHWRIRPGSGIVRGWCTLCAQPTCGSRRCQSCVPFEKRLALEHARARLVQALMKG